MKLPIREPIRTVDDLLGARARNAEGVYLHVPFCAHKCGYCDFYSIVDGQDRQEAYLKRVYDELMVAIRGLPSKLKTFYIGGGTPTLLRPDLLKRLIGLLEPLGLKEGIEFTVEANPETIDDEIAQILVDGYVTRVSLGAQSFNQNHLDQLERRHDPDTVFRAVSCLRNAGIQSISLDLIFGIPGQTIEDLKKDIEQLCSLGPDHASVYGLIYEPNTAMTERLKRGDFESCDQDLEALMYQSIDSMLLKNGMSAYELSSWSRPNHECLHNINYWNNSDWWAIGPSGSGHIDGVRWKNIPHLGKWLDSEGLSPVMDREEVVEDVRAGEILMTGLRLIKGMSKESLENVFLMDGGCRRRLVIDKYLELGLLQELFDGGIALTFKGRLLADSIFRDLIA